MVQTGSSIQQPSRPSPSHHASRREQQHAVCTHSSRPFLYHLIILALTRCGTALSLPLSSMLATFKVIQLLADFLAAIMSHSIGWLGQPLFSTRFKGNRASWTTSWFPFSPFQASASFFQLWRIKRWHFLAAAVVTVSLVNKVYRRIIDALDERLRFKRVLRDQMEHASSYQQWKQLAGSLEELETQDAKTHRASQRAHYDEALLKEKVAALKHLASPEHLACLPQPSSSPLPEPNSQANVNPRDLMFSLRMDLVRNIANIAKNGLNEQVGERSISFIRKVYLNPAQHHADSLDPRPGQGLHPRGPIHAPPDPRLACLPAPLCGETILPPGDQAHVWTYRSPPQWRWEPGHLSYGGETM